MFGGRVITRRVSRALVRLLARTRRCGGRRRLGRLTPRWRGGRGIAGARLGGVSVALRLLGGEPGALRLGAGLGVAVGLRALR